MMRNRWGVEIKKGHWIEGETKSGVVFAGRVVAVDRHGEKVTFQSKPMTPNNDGTAIAWINDIRVSLGPMNLADDGTVTQNPLTRVKVNSRSQATGKPPSKRLKKRRAATAAEETPGVYANPLTRVRVTSPSQRQHMGASGLTDSPTARLRKRRKTTKKAPEGFYANPAPLRYRIIDTKTRKMVMTVGTLKEAKWVAQNFADQVKRPMQILDTKAK